MVFPRLAKTSFSAARSLWIDHHTVGPSTIANTSIVCQSIFDESDMFSLRSCGFPSRLFEVRHSRYRCLGGTRYGRYNPRLDPARTTG